MLEPEGCFVAVHGTDKKNAIFDAKFLQSKYSRAGCKGLSHWHGCYVFKGFLELWDSIRDDVFRALNDFDCKSRPLYLVGHSLGAAIVHFILMETLDLGFDVKHAYMLETPRVGNDKFASTLRAAAGSRDVWRVVHYKDGVPHVPPRHVPMLSYTHAFPEIYYDNEKGSHYRECSIEDKSCSDQWSLTECSFDGHEHCWFEDTNPCACDNDTHTPPGTHPQAMVLV
jgi:hypothetical protein